MECHRIVASIRILFSRNHKSFRLFRGAHRTFIENRWKKIGNHKKTGEEKLGRAEENCHNLLILSTNEAEIFARFS